MQYIDYKYYLFLSVKYGLGLPAINEKLLKLLNMGYTDKFCDKTKKKPS
jgi:hypothetical protein